MTLGPFEGVNAGYVLELYERYRQNPESVDPSWRAYFEGRAAPAPARTDLVRKAPARAGNGDIMTPRPKRGAKVDYVA